MTVTRSDFAELRDAVDRRLAGEPWCIDYAQASALERILSRKDGATEPPVLAPSPDGPPHDRVEVVQGRPACAADLEPWPCWIVAKACRYREALL